MTNFDFLKKIDVNLYEIIKEAEKLYTAEFFEQCMGQTRRFGEQMCKSILAERRQYDGSFDDMIATLKDHATSIQEKEFVNDLYLRKKQDNISVHSSTVKRDGMAALECLQRAFEAAINYAVFYKKGNKSILINQYDIEHMMTGKTGKSSLSEKYETKKKETKKSGNGSNKKTSAPVKQSYTMKPKTYNKNKGITPFWIFVGISSIISTILILLIAVL